MPRHARKLSATGIYHVMLRGIDHATIFHDDEDCEKFLQVLSDCLSPLENEDEGHEDALENGVRQWEQIPLDAVVYQYCLMGNHVHLLLREGKEPVSTLMKRIGVRYARWYNRKYQRTGYLFQDRFRSVPVEDDAYFLAAYRYIALNPVKAGLCEAVGEYPWCGYRVTSRSTGTVPFSQCCEKGTVPIDRTVTIDCLPVEITAEQLHQFICSEQPSYRPFSEMISDRDAEAILLRITGLAQATDLAKLPKEEQIKFLGILQYNDLNILQMSRLTGIPKSNIARYLSG